MEKSEQEFVFLPASEDFCDKIYCEKCHYLLTQPCWLHATIIKDENVVPLSFASLPDVLRFGTGENGTKKSIFAKSTIRPQTVFGPLVAPPLHSSETCPRTILNRFPPGKVLAFNMENDKWCNWMKHVTVVRNKDEQNMKICEIGEDVFFVTVSVILPGEELRLAVGHNWAMRTCGNSSMRTTFGDMEQENHLHHKHLGFPNSNIPLPVIALDSDDFILVKAESLCDNPTEPPAFWNGHSENGLPCAKETDSQCALLTEIPPSRITSLVKDDSSSGLDVCRTVLPRLLDLDSSIPSLPFSAAEEYPTLCAALGDGLQRRYDRESSPEYPFPPLRQQKATTMIPQCQHRNNGAASRKNSSLKSDLDIKCVVPLLVPESTDQQEKTKIVAPDSLLASYGLMWDYGQIGNAIPDGAVDQRESHENSCPVDVPVCVDDHDKVIIRSYSLRPRAPKTVTYIDHSEQRKQPSCPADGSHEDETNDDSDVDADWLVTDTERETSPESEEWLDYESAPPAKKLKSLHRRFEEKDMKKSANIAPSLAIPTSVAPVISSETTDSVDIPDNTVLTSEIRVTKAVDIGETNAAIRCIGKDNYPSDVYRFKCPECLLHFRHDLLLQWHRQFQHAVSVGEPWKPRRKCAVCAATKEVFMRQETMMRHVEQHGVKASKIKHFVPTCDPSILRYVPDKDGIAAMADGFPVNHETHELCFIYYAEECISRDCTLRFCSESLLDLHKMKHMTPKTYEGGLGCPGCRYQADSPRSLFEHVGQHGAPRKDRKKCCRCGEFVVDMNHHAGSVHKETYEKLMSIFLPFACDRCEKRFLTNAFLKVHQAHKHGAPRMPQCYICAKQFPSTGLLRKHSDDHRTEAGLTCPTCKRSFRTYRKFSIHAKGHAVEQICICEICQAIFTSRAHLVQHQKVHGTDYKYNCDECGKSFKRPGNLWQHKRCVHSDTISKKRRERKEENQKKGIVDKYICPRRTMRYEDYPFKCEECRLGWLKLGALEQHKMRKHAVLGSDA